MKLTYFQLVPHLAKNLASIYIISGEEFILKQEAIDLIRDKAKKAGFNERTRLIPDTNFDWEALHLFLNSTSLLAEKRLLELDLRDATPNKNASAILCHYVKNLSPDQVLLIDIGKVDAKIAKCAWYQALESAGIAISIWPVPREQMPQWVMERAKKSGVQITREAAILLGEYCEGNLSSATQALEKLALLGFDKAIDAETIASALNDEGRFTVFDFVESLIAGDKARSLHILDSLKADGTEPVLVLWAITRELRLLAEMSQQLKDGLSYADLYQKHRIFARRQTTIRRFLSTASEDICRQHLIRAAETDKIIKGAMAGNAWNNLQLFCLSLV